MLTITSRSEAFEDEMYCAGMDVESLADAMGYTLSQLDYEIRNLASADWAFWVHAAKALDVNAETLRRSVLG